MSDLHLANSNLSKLPPSAWGHPDRHYAVGPEATHAAGRGPGEQDAGRWGEALEKASPGIREVVERTYKQWNTILRDYLRNETALRLSVGGEAQAVPVRVVDGMPRPFAEVMRGLEGLERLLLNRPFLVEAASGTRFMAEQSDMVPRRWHDKAGPSGREEIIRVQHTAEAWLKELDEAKAVDQIIGINEDVLGAYFFYVPEIRLYWVVIGITAMALGVSVEAMTIVVLAHELAHAYSHLGRDIDNEKWLTEKFAAADLNIVEGLAQFYTSVLCRRLEQRMPAAIHAYKELLKKQSGPYRAHLGWVDDNERGGEIIRVSMIECRSLGITDSAKFLEAIEKYRQGIRGRKKPRPDTPTLNGFGKEAGDE
jgi:hypothetical protein